MATTCQIYPVDYPRTAGSRLFDLNDPTGANALDVGYTSTQLLQTVDLGSPQFEFDRFSPPQRDGGSTTNQRAGFRNVVIPFRMRAASYDNLAQAMGRLSSYISQGCTIVWQADTSSNVRYIDVEPSQTPYFLDGRELSMHLATTMVDTPDGIQLTLVAQPYLRGAELDSDTNLLDNATLLRDADGAARPDGWVWTSATNITLEEINATDEAYQFDIATGATRILTQSTGAATAASGETWTMSGYARVTSASYTNAQTQAVMTWRTSAPADISTSSGTLVPLTTAWQRVSVTATAPATTDRIQAGLQMDNTSATAATVQWKNLQLEEAAAATPFHVGSEVSTMEPEPASGMGRMFPVYNPGDAPAALQVWLRNTTSSTAVADIGVTNAVPPSGDRVTLMNSAHLFQIEDWTNGTDTAVDTNANSSPQTGNTGKLTTFVTTTEVGRANTTITTASVRDSVRGHEWRAILRLGARTSTWVGTARLAISLSALSFLDTTITETALASTEYRDYDMGTVTFPDLDLASFQVNVYASRTSGTGNLVWDYLLLVPAETFATVDLGGSLLSAGDSFATDPDNAGVRAVNTSGADVATAEVAGPVPAYIAPGVNFVYVGSMTAAVRTSVLTNALAVRSVVTPRYYL